MTQSHIFNPSFRPYIIIAFILIISSNAIAQLSCGQAIDFNTWSQEGVAASGNWVIAPGGNAVEQTINGQSTWFVSPNDFIDVLIQGSIQVNTASDDDLVGFVFGYQDPIGVMANPANTYTKSFFFDWKEGTQNYQGNTSFEGFALYEVDGFYNYSAPFYFDFWNRQTTPTMTLIDTDYGNNGWNDFQQYDFQLKYTTDSIVIWIDGNRIFEEEGCYEAGKFGFYNFSQSLVNYSNFSYNIEYDFAISDSLICLGDTSFFEIGVGCNSLLPGNISYSWDFGDGATAQGINPFHIYSVPGIYQAILISTDAFGCTDSSIHTVEVMGYPVSNAGIDDISCTFDYGLNASPPTGQWSALTSGVFVDASLSSTTVTVPSPGAYEFIWEATNVAGCSTNDTVSIAFNELSVTTVTLTDPTCNGETNGEILITTSGGVQPIDYQWNAAAGNQTTNPATNLGAGTFNLVITDDFGCSIDTNLTLSEPNPLTFSFDVLPSDCDFADGSAAFSNVSGGTALYTYDWGTGFVPDDFSNGLSSGLHSVTIEDNQGCDSIVSYTILNTPFIINANVLEDISCFGFNDGEGIAFGPNLLAAYTYQWGASSNNQITQTATNLVPGNHDVTITSSEGCSQTTSITILEPTALTLATTNLSACIGDLINLSGIAGGGTLAYTYAWENSLGQAIMPNNLLVNQTELYTVTVTDANNCVLSEDLTVTGLLTPTASFTVDLIESCLEPSYIFNFQNTSTPAGGNVTWDFGDNTLGSGDVTTHSYIGSGVFDVSVEVTSPNGCADTHLETGLITIYPNPTADFVFSPNVITTLNSIVQFIDVSFADVDTWNWSFGENFTSNSQNPVFDYESRIGNQVIELEVESIHGCIGSTSRIIEIKNEVIVYAPNAFTPDGDEFNQTWKVYLAGMDLFDIEIDIYNRWGELIWKSFDIEVGWDGTYTGKIVPNGIYTWTLVASDLNTDGKYERTGHINVLR